MAVAFALLGVSIYIWIGVIAFLFLLILVVLGDFGVGGGDVDVGGDLDYGEFVGPGISPLSPPLLATFGSTFGAMGAILERQGVDPLPVAFLSGVAGMAASVGMFFVVQKYLVRAQTSSDVHPEELVGRDAQVLIPIGRGQSGQILIITPERGRTLFSAIAEEEIPRDSIVEILGFVGGVANVRKKLG